MSSRAVNHIDFMLHGQLPGGEIWSCTVAYAESHGGQMRAPTFTELTGMALALDAQWIVFWNSQTTRWGLGVNYTGLKAYYRPANQGQATVEGEVAGVTTSGTGAVTLPNQCARVLTLLSGRPGRKNRGRIYLPMLAFGVGTSQAPLDEIASNFATAMNTASDDMNTTFGLDVAILAGELPATTCEVDNLIDTQRRRRNKLVPAAKGGASFTAH